MASRLASGGINLAASASSHHVSAAAGPDVNYCRPTDEGGRDETKQDACRRERGWGRHSLCRLCAGPFSLYFPPFLVGFRLLLLLLLLFFFFPLLHE